MEPIFVNRCVYTRANLLDMNRRMRKLASTALLILLDCYFFYAIVMAVSKANTFNIILNSVFALLFTALAIFLPRLGVARTYYRYKEDFGSELETLVSFYKDKLVGTIVQNSAGNATPYEAIDKVIRTKKLILLVMNNRSVMMLDRTGFEKGTEDAFFTFLKSKAAKAKFSL